MDAGLLPTVLPKPSSRPRTARPLNRVCARRRPPSDFRPQKIRPRPRTETERTDRTSRPTRPADSFASGEANKLFRPSRPGTEEFRPLLVAALSVHQPGQSHVRPGRKTTVPLGHLRALPQAHPAKTVPPQPPLPPNPLEEAGASCAFNRRGIPSRCRPQL